MPAFTALTHKSKAETYYFTPELQEAVNAAITLGMPLLLTGEPGTGKTRLVHYLKGSGLKRLLCSI